MYSMRPYEYPCAVRYRRPRREILVDPLSWEFEQRESGDGLDRLLDEGVEPFSEVPPPHPRAVAKARAELKHNPKLKHPRFTERATAEIAYSTAICKARLRPTVLQMRVMLALLAAIPTETLLAELAVLHNGQNATTRV